MARFYGWSHAEMWRMSWRALVAYARILPALEAEEQLRWLTILHPADPQKLQTHLRERAMLRAPARRQRQEPMEDALDAWLLDPFLARNIEIIDSGRSDA